MVSNAIKSNIRSSKMAAGSHFVKKKLLIDLKWREMRSKVIFGHFGKQNKDAYIDLKWREIRSKVIFGHPKWSPASILWKKSCVLILNSQKCDREWFSVIQNGRQQPFGENKIKVAYWSEMTRTAIKNDFRSSKMAAGSHFMKKKHIDLKLWEMWLKVIFGHPKMATDNHIIKKLIIRVAFGHFVKTKVAYWSEPIESDFRWSKMDQIGVSKMAVGGHLRKCLNRCHFVKEMRIDLKWREMRSKVIFGHPKCSHFDWPAAILWIIFQKSDQKWLSFIQNGHFLKKMKKKM